MSHTTKLAARVAARNKADKIANELYEPLAAIFRPYLGQQIYKSDGELLAKIAKQLPPLPNTHAERVCRYKTPYSLAWEISVNEPYERSGPVSGAVIYEKAMLYIGHIVDGVLGEICDKDELRDDYTVDEVLSRREALAAAKKAFDAAQSALYPFREHDNY